MNVQLERALPGYRDLLRQRDAGLTVAEIAKLMDLGKTEVYARIARAKRARAQGLI